MAYSETPVALPLGLNYEISRMPAIAVIQAVDRLFASALDAGERCGCWQTTETGP